MAALLSEPPKLTTRSVLDTADKIGCLKFLHSLQKKLVGSLDPKRTRTPCIKVQDTKALHRGLLAYQISNLVFNGPMEEELVCSHICANQKKGDDPIRTCPCIGPLHMEHATIGQNSGRNDHQLALIKWARAHQVALGSDAFSGPIFLKFKDKSQKGGVGTTRLLRNTCHHIKAVGDCCFYNFKEHPPYAKGFMFPEEMQPLIDKANLQSLIDRINENFNKN